MPVSSLLCTYTVCSVILFQLSKKIIMFSDVEQKPVETCLPGSPKNYIPPPDSLLFKAISSLENEICLFPESTSDSVCKCIGTLMAQNRHV